MTFPAITLLEARSRPTSHHMDPSHLPGHANIGDWCSWAGLGQIVLAANRNGGMLRLIASRHDDDDDMTFPHPWNSTCISIKKTFINYQYHKMPNSIRSCTNCDSWLCCSFLCIIFWSSFCHTLELCMLDKKETWYVILQHWQICSMNLLYSLV